MTTKVFSNRRAGFFLVSEANKTRSRATIVVDAGQGKLEAGTVLALKPNGRYGAYDNDGTAATNAARAILFDGVDTTTLGAQKAVAIVRDAEVHGNEIVFKASEDTGDKEAAYADLATQGIIVRFETRVT